MAKFVRTTTATVALTAGVMSVFGLAGYFAFPHVLRWRVEKKIPGVTFEDVRLDWPQVTLRGVAFDKGWAKGRIETVEADWRGQGVRLRGGRVEVDLDARPSSGGGSSSEGRDILVQGVAATVRKSGYVVDVEGVRTDGSRVCFDSGKVRAPEVLLERGCVERDGSKVTLASVGAPLVGLGGVQVESIAASGVEADLKAKTFKAEGASAQVTVHGQPLPLEATGVVLQHGEEDVLRVQSARTRHAWISPEWTSFEQLEVRRGAKTTIRVGEAQVDVDLERLSASGNEGCGAWLGAFPESMRQAPIDKLKMDGTMEFRLELKPSPKLHLDSTCRATCNTLPDLHRPFTYQAYTSKGQRFERTSGPGSKDWVPLRATGKMPLSVVTMEDPGFYKHRGFIRQAFANSLVDNLKQGRFLRGGSTITMQLAKNLWLSREKTLGRKAQELFLAQALETCYSKEEILELYLNVVEFGPDVYGVGAGAQHWFERGPAELEPEEALWMASILPRPSRTSPPNELALERMRMRLELLRETGRMPKEESDDEFQNE